MDRETQKTLKEYQIRSDSSSKKRKLEPTPSGLKATDAKLSREDLIELKSHVRGDMSLLISMVKDQVLTIDRLRASKYKYKGKAQKNGELLAESEKKLKDRLEENLKLSIQIADLEKQLAEQKDIANQFNLNVAVPEPVQPLIPVSNDSNQLTNVSEGDSNPNDGNFDFDYYYH